MWFKNQTKHGPTLNTKSTEKCVILNINCACWCKILHARNNLLGECRSFRLVQDAMRRYLFTLVRKRNGRYQFGLPQLAYKDVAGNAHGRSQRDAHFERNFLGVHTRLLSCEAVVRGSSGHPKDLRSSRGIDRQYRAQLRGATSTRWWCFSVLCLRKRLGTSQSVTSSTTTVWFAKGKCQKTCLFCSSCSAPALLSYSVPFIVHHHHHHQSHHLWPQLFWKVI